MRVAVLNLRLGAVVTCRDANRDAELRRRHPQLTESTPGSLAEALITALRQSMKPFSSNVEK